MASPLTTLALAVLAAAGALLPWAAPMDGSRRGWSYDDGLVAIVAAAEVAIVCALRASGNINRRQYLGFGLLFACIGFGATIWFYFDVVGSTDSTRQLISFFSRPWIAGSTGLYLSMAGFVGQVVALLWHLDHGVRKVVHSTIDSPLLTAAFIGMAGVGVLLPWAESQTWDESQLSAQPGWSFNYGLVALVTAIEVGIVCALRISGHVRVAPYAMIGLLSALVGLGAVAWFHNDVLGGVNPTGYHLLVSWLNAPRSEGGLRESVSAAGFIGTIAVLAWQLRQASERGEMSLRFRWPWSRAARAA